MTNLITNIISVYASEAQIKKIMFFIKSKINNDIQISLISNGGVNLLSFDTSEEFPLNIFQKLKEKFKSLCIYAGWRDKSWPKNKYYMDFGFEEDAKGLIDLD